jgi:hypothetical protein
MKRYVTVLALWLALLGCHNQSIDRAICQVKDPLTDLDWLRAIVANEQTPYLQIEQGRYEGRIVYIVSRCGLCFAGGVVTVYACDGAEICHFGTYILDPNPECKAINARKIADRKVLLTR